MDLIGLGERKKTFSIVSLLTLTETSFGFIHIECVILNLCRAKGRQENRGPAGFASAGGPRHDDRRLNTETFGQTSVRTNVAGFSRDAPRGFSHPFRNTFAPSPRAGNSPSCTAHSTTPPHTLCFKNCAPIDLMLTIVLHSPHLLLIECR